MPKVIKPLEKEQKEKSVEFTGYLNSESVTAWKEKVGENMRQPSDSPMPLVYMGKCKVNGDMFYDVDSTGRICIFRGHLNSGEY